MPHTFPLIQQEHVIYFSNKDQADLVRKLDYYLSHQKEAACVAHNERLRASPRSQHDRQPTAHTNRPYLNRQLTTKRYLPVAPLACSSAMISVFYLSLAKSSAVFPYCKPHALSNRTARTHLLLDVDLHPTISQKNLYGSSMALVACKHESSPSILAERRRILLNADAQQSCSK